MLMFGCRASFQYCVPLTERLALPHGCRRPSATFRSCRRYVSDVLK